MSLPWTLSFFSPEEYLTFERGTDARHEYLDGHVYALADESIEHSRICINMGFPSLAYRPGSAPRRAWGRWRPLPSPPPSTTPTGSGRPIEARVADARR